MKNSILILFIIGLCLSCKQEKNNTSKVESLTVAQKIANAHGYEHWSKVSEIQFTFNKGRSWVWKPKSNDVTLMTSKDTINYNRASIDSVSLKADRAFINDKFWLLIPFQLVWDAGVTISEPEVAVAPVSKTKMNKITMTYSNKGGYTPGDAYDLFYGDDYIIKEWGFRKGNKPEAGLINTFENYQDFNGLKLALDHKNNVNDWSLPMSNVKVTLE